MRLLRGENMSTAKILDKAIKNMDSVTVTYEDALGDDHTYTKSSEEEAKAWIDAGKFPHGIAYNIKINGKLYKKMAR